MSAFAVRNTDSAPISSEKMMIELSSTPTSWKPLSDRVRRRSSEAVEIDVEGVHEVELVVHALDGLATRHAVDELERPERLSNRSGVAIERSASLETVIGHSSWLGTSPASLGGRPPVLLIPLV